MDWWHILARLDLRFRAHFPGRPNVYNSADGSPGRSIAHTNGALRRGAKRRSRSPRGAWALMTARWSARPMSLLARRGGEGDAAAGRRVAGAVRLPGRVRLADAWSRSMPMPRALGAARRTRSTVVWRGLARRGSTRNPGASVRRPARRIGPYGPADARQPANGGHQRWATARATARATRMAGPRAGSGHDRPPHGAAWRGPGGGALRGQGVGDEVGATTGDKQVTGDRQGPRGRGARTSPRSGRSAAATTSAWRSPPRRRRALFSGPHCPRAPSLQAIDRGSASTPRAVLPLVFVACTMAAVVQVRSASPSRSGRP